MPCVIFQKVPIHKDSAVAEEDLRTNLNLCCDIHDVQIRFLQNTQTVQDNLTVQDAEVHLEKNEDKQYLIENSPWNFCINDCIVYLNVIDSYEKLSIQELLVLLLRRNLIDAGCNNK